MQSRSRTTGSRDDDVDGWVDGPVGQGFRGVRSLLWHWPSRDTILLGGGSRSRPRGEGQGWRAYRMRRLQWGGYAGKGTPDGRVPVPNCLAQTPRRAPDEEPSSPSARPFRPLACAMAGRVRAAACSQASRAQPQSPVDTYNTRGGHNWPLDFDSLPTKLPRSPLADFCDFTHHSATSPREASSPPPCSPSAAASCSTGGTSSARARGNNGEPPSNPQHPHPFHT